MFVLQHLDGVDFLLVVDFYEAVEEIEGQIEVKKREVIFGLLVYIIHDDVRIVLRVEPLRACVGIGEFCFVEMNVLLGKFQVRNEDEQGLGYQLFNAYDRLYILIFLLEAVAFLQFLILLGVCSI